MNPAVILSPRSGVRGPTLALAAHETERPSLPASYQLPEEVLTWNRKEEFLPGLLEAGGRWL